MPIDDSPASYVQPVSLLAPISWLTPTYTDLIFLHLREGSFQRLKPACGRICNICLLNAADAFVGLAHAYYFIKCASEEVATHYIPIKHCPNSESFSKSSP